MIKVAINTQKCVGEMGTCVPKKAVVMMQIMIKRARLVLNLTSGIRNVACETLDRKCH